MKLRTFVLCLALPTVPLWLWIDHLAEKKYRVVPAGEYWKSQLSGQSEFFRAEGFVWFAPPPLPLHGYWPLRTPETEIDADFFPAWNQHILALISNTNYWDTNIVQSLCLLTGTDCGTNQAAWVKWKSENSVTKEQALQNMKNMQRANQPLSEYFHWHVRNRHWLATFESVFYCGLWMMAALLARLRFTIKGQPFKGSRLFKWSYGAFVCSAAAFFPWLFDYGAGAFSTWQGPEALTSSGSYLWHGQFSYGNSITYRCFVEIAGTPPLWLLQHLSAYFPVTGLLAFYFSFVFFYAVAGFLLATPFALFLKRTSKS